MSEYAESRWDMPDLEPWERVGWEEQQREWPEDEPDEDDDDEEADE